MPSSGSGTGTPVTSLSVPIAGAARTCINLARYAARILYSECAFFGVRNESDPAQGECRSIWTLSQRNDIAYYLAEAQEELEQEIGYFLCPRYIVGQLSSEPESNDLYVDDQVMRSNPARSRWPKVIAAGIRAESTIRASAMVDHSQDPAIIGPIATTVTSVSEIHVYYPGEDVEIPYSSITLSGCEVTIRIPRCRMVAPEFLDNDTDGLDYTDLGNFLDAVDVIRVYTDPSVNATLVTPHSCSSLCVSSGCSEYTRTGCIYIEDGRLGHLHITPASYTDGAWRSSGLCRPYTRVRLNYLSGAASLTRQAEDAILRLAHSKMPDEPCGCDISQRFWRRDRNVPEVLTRERINCRFGMSDGAWQAWQFAQAMKHVVGSVL